jgi:hypothetical protein
MVKNIRPINPDDITACCLICHFHSYPLYGPFNEYGDMYNDDIVCAKDKTAPINEFTVCDDFERCDRLDLEYGYMAYLVKLEDKIE